MTTHAGLPGIYFYQNQKQKDEHQKMKATEIMTPRQRRFALIAAVEKLKRQDLTRRFGVLLSALELGTATQSWIDRQGFYESHQSPGTIVDTTGNCAISADGVWLESEESGQLEPRTDVLSENELQAVIDELALYQWRKG